MRKIKILSRTFLGIMSVFGAVSCQNSESLRQVDRYETYNFSDVLMRQTGIDSFEISFTIDAEEDLDFYLTDRDKLTTNEVPLLVDKDGDKYSFDATLNLNSEYYLWGVGAFKEAFLPLTVPSMFPYIEKKVNSADYEFNFSFTPGVSWSSFCDPTGKNIYASSSSIFDDSATPLVENVAITDGSTTISASDYDEALFYYSVIEAKNGLVKIVSTPIVAKDRFSSDLTSLTAILQNINSKPTFSLTAGMREGSLFVQDASKLQLIIKNTSGDEIHSAKATPTSSGLRMTVDLTTLEDEGNRYDIVFAYAGTVYMDVPKQLVSGKDIYNTSYLDLDDTKYSFQNWEGSLKVVYAHYADKFLSDYKITMTPTGENPALNLKAQAKEGVNEPVFAVTSGNKTKIISSSSTFVDGFYEASLNIASSAIDMQGNRYDIRIFFGSEYGEVKKTIATDASTYSISNVYGNKKYSFAEYEGILKFQYVLI
jgi:hypothetical protein